MKKIFPLLAFLYLSPNVSADNQNAPQDSAVENYVYYHMNHGNTEAAANFLRTLEQTNHPEGLFLLGSFYLNGYGVTKDLCLANCYFFRSAHLGFAPAFKALGDSYLAGDGVRKCPEMALYYYECAARRGYGPGQFNAGALLKEGEDNLKANPKQAHYWLDQAAHNQALGDLAIDAAALRDQISG
ncbi:tetratricopeptide repeat protein [Candidatus Finniella inopinata]|uniref:Sel1 repeat family protein n=1 Tax=Candidatus Finniella inopinata TaxID=1696036 RepID=A0A4Q7DLG3_9PROT|nr:tetratricopeptide repeat protein [Candidatus Finniella inopinata]RZI47095.1 sel1 repeat family protein [Candidatus Finniella inopinata]